MTPQQALFQALRTGRVDEARAAIAAGADINVPEGYEPLDSPLEALVRGRRSSRILDTAYTEIAQLLIDHGADIRATSTPDATLLHLAAAGGYVGIARLLLERGLSVAAQDSVGNTPLHEAADGGHDEIVRLLIERGGDVNARNAQGQTPLHRARGNHCVTARLLVEAGAVETVRDEEGWLPDPGHTARRRAAVVQTADRVPPRPLFADRVEGKREPEGGHKGRG